MLNLSPLRTLAPFMRSLGHPLFVLLACCVALVAIGWAFRAPEPQNPAQPAAPIHSPQDDRTTAARTSVSGAQAQAPFARDPAADRPRISSSLRESAAPSFNRIRHPGAAPLREERDATASAPASPVEHIFELAPGMLAPAAVARTQEQLRLAPDKEALKEKIAVEFAQNVDRAVKDPATTPESLGATWSVAQRRADERFRLMFGDAAFVKQSAAAARAALGPQ